jgi:hypothetical protein
LTRHRSPRFNDDWTRKKFEEDKCKSIPDLHPAE